MSNFDRQPLQVQDGLMASADSQHAESLSEESRRLGRILVVDDDVTTRNMVVNYLSKHQLLMASASGQKEMERSFAEAEPNLVILDLSPGKEDDFALLHEIRSRSDVPIIITTGHRCDEIDRAVGLELGADDYVTKPFGLRELLARIRAVMRRHQGARHVGQREAERGRYKFGGWRLERE